MWAEFDCEFSNGNNATEDSKISSEGNSASNFDAAWGKYSTGGGGTIFSAVEDSRRGGGPWSKERPGVPSPPMTGQWGQPFRVDLGVMVG